MLEHGQWKETPLLSLRACMDVTNSVSTAGTRAELKRLSGNMLDQKRSACLDRTFSRDDLSGHEVLMVMGLAFHTLQPAVQLLV